MRLCDFDGCDRRHEARGYCKMHYQQLRLKGEVSELKKRVPVALTLDERLTYDSHQEGDCRLWHGTKNTTGYPKIKFEGQWYSPSRYVWERENGPLGNKRLRQSCGNSDCIALDHQELKAKVLV